MERRTLSRTAQVQTLSMILLQVINVTETEGENLIPIIGSLTYQPSVPMGDMELLVSQESYRDVKQFTTSFTIDQFMGGDLKVQVDVGHDFANRVIGSILIKSEAVQVFEDLTIDSNGVYQYLVGEGSPDAELWTGDIMIQANLTRKIDFISLKISSKPRGDTLPLRTRCWTSSGSETVSVEDGGLLYILAEVKQGNSPVIGASVK